ncbi:hypothetical protein K9M79_01935 [Candidatus Woesearchaeota archaeon]|nr:hypothetical protein [Candidatus Woesearchaeota archaeon]
MDDAMINFFIIIFVMIIINVITIIYIRSLFKQVEKNIVDLGGKIIFNFEQIVEYIDQKFIGIYNRVDFIVNDQEKNRPK